MIVLMRRKGRKSLDFIKEIWSYLKIRKKFWLAPILIFVVLVGSLLIMAQSSPVAPFIYTLF